MLKKHLLLLSMLKTAVPLIIFVENNEKFKRTAFIWNEFNYSLIIQLLFLYSFIFFFLWMSSFNLIEKNEVTVRLLFNFQSQDWVPGINPA